MRCAIFSKHTPAGAFIAVHVHVIRAYILSQIHYLSMKGRIAKVAMSKFDKLCFIVFLETFTKVLWSSSNFMLPKNKCCSKESGLLKRDASRAKTVDKLMVALKDK